MFTEPSEVSAVGTVCAVPPRALCALASVTINVLARIPTSHMCFIRVLLRQKSTAIIAALRM
jgi:hypothetical protein